MRQRFAVLTDQQREQICSEEDKISMSGYSLTTFFAPCINNRSIYSNRTIISNKTVSHVFAQLIIILLIEHTSLFE